MGVCALSSAAVAAVLADALDAPGLVEASAALAAKGWGVLMGADFACSPPRLDQARALGLAP